MKYKLLDLSDSDEWNRLTMMTCSQNDIYYTPAYYSLYEKLGHGKACCFVCIQKESYVIFPFLLNEVNKLGFNLDKTYYDIQGAYGYNGIISSSNDENVIKGFYVAFSQFCQEHNIIAEFTRFHPLLRNELYASDFMTVIQDRETVVLNLSNEYSEIWDLEYSSKNRNKIQKAKKLGYRIQVLDEPNEVELNIFYEIYNHSMLVANADRFYFFSRKYFSDIFVTMKEYSVLFNVLNSDDEVICSSIFFRCGEYFHYHLSGRNANADNASNNFLLDEAIIYAKKNGAKYFHLGGGRGSTENDSLFKFKKNFSKHVLPFFIGKNVHNINIYNEVVSQWEHKYPEKTEHYKNILLKYRM